MLYDSELEESDALEPRALSPVNGDSGEEDSTSEFLRQRTQWPRRIGSSDEESPPSARTSMERGSPGLSEEAKAIIEDTYRSVWTEFYEWEPSHCTSTLQSLASELSDEPASFDFGLEDGDWCVEAHWTGDVVSEHSDVDDLLSASNQFDVWQWTSYGTVHKGTTAPAVAIVVEDGATPHPRYEACTPTDFPIDPETHGEAPHCSFIKYAGMPGFDEKRYLRLFTSIEWQQPWRDPDHSIIAFTAIQRLTAWTESDTAPSLPVYVDDIDDTQIFNRNQNPSRVNDDVSSVSSILQRIRQRDKLIWPGNPFSEISAHTNKNLWRDPNRSDDKGRMSAICAAYCPNLECVRATCLNHPYPSGYIPSRSLEGTLTHEELLQKAKYKPCSERCFLDMHSEEVQKAIEWDKEPELEALDTILLLTPDVLPCNLSPILPQTACYKIFARRCETVQGYEPPKGNQKATPAEMFVDNVAGGDAFEFTMPVRCAHKGPCGNQAVPECPCFSNNVHCRRNCQCSSQCTRRHKGCRCSNGKSLCGESNHKKTRCKCSKEARECDPEVCRHGRPAIKKGRAANKIPPKCDNYVMQRASPVALAVQSGSYGLGTFTRQNILKGNFVGAYVGEILWSNSGDHQTLEQKFTGYNYMFAHTQSQLLDAKSVGNETRYINHAKPPKANVEARFKLVNGEQKIGFFAIKHIKPGKELLFDYGDNYWRQNE